MSILMPVQDCLDYSNFAVSFEITKYRLPSIFFFKTILALLCRLHLHMILKSSLQKEKESPPNIQVLIEIDLVLNSIVP